MSKKKHKVFVYGTLRPEGQDWTHYLLGYAMYDAGRFPYILQDNHGIVYGNVLEVTEKQLSRLDDYEAVDSGLYLRQKAPVRAGGAIQQSDYEEMWVYAAGPRLTPRHISSGDWFNP